MHIWCKYSSIPHIWKLVIEMGWALWANIFLLYCTSFFYGLNFSPNCQIHIRNYLMLYLYINKYVAEKSHLYKFFSTLNCQCSRFSKKNPIIWIFCIYGWLAVPISPDKWSSTVILSQPLYTNRHEVSKEITA